MNYAGAAQTGDGVWTGAAIITGAGTGAAIVTGAGTGAGTGTGAGAGTGTDQTTLTTAGYCIAATDGVLITTGFG